MKNFILKFCLVRHLSIYWTAYLNIYSVQRLAKNLVKYLVKHLTTAFRVTYRLPYQMVFFGIALNMLGCGNSELPQYTKLDRLRILAITTPTPEVSNPGAGPINVDITPYLSDVEGSGDVVLTIQSCLDPGTSLGAAPTCEGAAAVSALQTVNVTAPAGQADGTFGSPERTGAPSSGAITVPVDVNGALLSQYPDYVQKNGVSYLVTVTAQSGGTVLRSFRRILFSTKAANANPTLTDLTDGSTSLTTIPSGELDLSFTFGGNPESYVFYGDGIESTRIEDYEVTWFTSDGEILNPRTKAGESTKWTAPESPPVGREVVLAGVLRDGRGGVAVIVKTLN